MLKRFAMLGLVVCFAASLGCGPGQPGDPVVPDPLTVESNGIGAPAGEATGMVGPL